jgi:hypothetical protein
VKGDFEILNRDNSTLLGNTQMTDIHIVSGLRDKKQPAEIIKYDAKAIAKGKELAATLKSGDEAEWHLGKLADQLEPKYKDKTLARFAKDIGLEADRLNRCRSVYRGWKDEDIKGPAPKFGVKQALQAHPQKAELLKKFPNMTRADARAHMRIYKVREALKGHPLCEEIIKDNPKLTLSQARTRMNDYNSGQGKGQHQDQAQTQAQTQDENWKVNEVRRYYAQVAKHAQEAIKYRHPFDNAFLDPDLLRQALDNPDQTIASLRLGGNALISAADAVEHALAPPLALPAPMWTDEVGPGDAAATPDPPDAATPGDTKSDEATSDETPDQGT